MAAQKLGLHPQQHQLLLQIAGAPEKVAATIGYLAERLGLRHNTVVELSNRCEQAGLVTAQAGWVRPAVVCCLRSRPRGREMLEALSIDHARELNELCSAAGSNAEHAEDGPSKTGKASGRRNGEI